MLDPQLAQKIIGEVRLLIQESIIVTDQNGVIIASTDGQRVGQSHEGAKIVTRQKSSLIITRQKAEKWPGVRAGINLPVFFHHTVAGVIGITGKPEKVSKYAQLLRKMTELLIHESYIQKQFDFRERKLEAFIFDWLNDRAWDEPFFGKARLLNIDLSCDRQAVFIYVPELAGKDDQQLWREIYDWLPPNQGDLLVRWGDDHLLILVDQSNPKRQISRLIDDWCSIIERWTGARPKMGVGSSLPPSELKQSFHQAKRALNAATDHQPIIFDKELTLEMISEELTLETKRLFIKRTIGQLMKDKETLNTLKRLFEHQFSLKETADFMHIHINTLHYRLKKVEQLTGLDIKAMRSRVVLYLALLFLDEHTK